MKKRVIVSLFFGVITTVIYLTIEYFIMNTEFSWVKTLLFFVMFCIAGFISYRGNKNN